MTTTPCPHARQWFGDHKLDCAWPRCTEACITNVMHMVVYGRERTWRRVRVCSDWFWVTSTDSGGVWTTSGTVEIEVPIG
jgi:hypothetical protein